MQAIGITGGIGSGKSTIAKMIEKLGYPVYVADREASRLINSDPDIHKELTERFGASIYRTDGTLDKPRVASIVFEDPSALSAINRIVHPRVMKDFQHWQLHQEKGYVFFESAILFEAGLHTHFQSIICVTAPEILRLQRVMARDHTTADKVRERMQNQLDDSIKCQQSDYTIYNDEIHPVIEQVLEILKKIKATSQQQNL